MDVLTGLREEKELTQQEVADQLSEKWRNNKDRYGDASKITQATYGHWERGHRKPPAEVIVLLADYYNCSADYLLEITDTRSQRVVPILAELKLERESWWEIKRETTHDERACAKVFAWIASGKSTSDVLAMRDDRDWKESKWGAERPDISTIQAMLMAALDDGIVDIIADAMPHDEDQAMSLKSEFPLLQEVRVVKTSENELLAKILVGEVAAILFNNIVRPGQSIGLSGGTTLARMAAALKKYPCAGIKLYPFDNGLIPESVDVCANTLIGQIKYSHPAAHIDAYALQYLAVDVSARSYKFPPNDANVLRVLTGAQNIDAGFVGFGAVTPNYLQDNPALAGVLNATGTTVDVLVNKDKAIGNVLFHCFREDGSYIINRLNSRIGSVRPQRLIELAESGRPIVGMACGREKGRAGLGLLNGRYVNNLVVDDKLADTILEAKKEFDKKQK